MRPPVARRSLVLRLAARLLVVCLGTTMHTAGAAQPPGDRDMRSEFERARALAGVDTAQARTLIATLRAQAVAGGQAGWRLALDNSTADC